MKTSVFTYKPMILITNYHEWISNLDERIKSRLTPESIDFKAYTFEETKDIFVALDLFVRLLISISSIIISPDNTF